MLATKNGAAFTVAKYHVSHLSPVGPHFSSSLRRPNSCGQLRLALFMDVWFQPWTIAAMKSIANVLCNDHCCWKKPSLLSYSSASFSSDVRVLFNLSHNAGRGSFNALAAWQHH